MKGIDIKKVSLSVLIGIAVTFIIGLFFTLGFGFYAKDVFFLEGLSISIAGLFSILGNGVNDLWISRDHNGTKTVNEEVLIMEEERKTLINSFSVEQNSLIAIIVGIIFIIISLI